MKNIIIIGKMTLMNSVCHQILKRHFNKNADNVNVISELHHNTSLTHITDILSKYTHLYNVRVEVFNVELNAQIMNKFKENTYFEIFAKEKDVKFIKEDEMNVVDELHTGHELLIDILLEDEAVKETAKEMCSEEFLQLIRYTDSHDWIDTAKSEVKDKIFMLITLTKRYGSERAIEMIMECTMGKLILDEEVMAFFKPEIDDHLKTVHELLDKAKQDVIVYRKGDVCTLILYDFEMRYFSLIAKKLASYYRMDLRKQVTFVSNIQKNGIISVRGCVSKDDYNIPALMRNLKGCGGGKNFAAGGRLFSNVLAPTSKIYNNREVLTDQYLEFLNKNILEVK